MRDTENHLLGAVTLLEDITHLREIDRLKSGIHRHWFARVANPADQRADGSSSAA